MPRNVLITSAGRRGLLVKYFREELRRLVPGGKVFAADCRPELSAACQLADGSFPVPRVSEPGYIDGLIRRCLDLGIGMIVPTIDTELLILAEHRDRLRGLGIEAVISDPALIELCRDKRLTASLFEGLGIAAPAGVDPRGGEVGFPVFAKPYDGSCSMGLRVIRGPGDLTPELLADPKMMFVEYLDPSEHDEYTIDAYYDRGGELRCFVPRLRLETRGGEVSKGRTARPKGTEHLRDRFRHLGGARGCITVQVFAHRGSKQFFGIEINPRFGGGFPLTYQAGAAYPSWLIHEYLLGESIESYDDWETDLAMLRYDSHVLVRHPAA